MQEGAKKRLAGAVVVITLAIVFVPMLFEEQASDPTYVPGPLSAESSVPSTFDAPYPDQGFLSPPGTQTLTEAETQLTPSEPLQNFAPVDPEAAAVDDGDALVFDPLQEPTGPFVAAPTQPPPTAPTPASRQAAPVSRPQPTPAPRPAQPPSRPTPPPAPPPRREPSVAAAPPPPKPRPDAPAVWIVQVASLNSADAANNLAAKLKQSGFAAFVESAVVNGRTYYRVRVGPSSERDQANRLADKLRKQHKLDTLIQRYSQ